MVRFSPSRREKETGLKKGVWSAEEDHKLIAYIKRYGIWNWSYMPKAAGLERSGKSCRLRWVNYLRPDIKHGNFSKEEEETIIRLNETLGNRWSKIAAQLPGRTDNEVKNYWHAHLKKRFKVDSTVLPKKMQAAGEAPKAIMSNDVEAHQNKKKQQQQLNTSETEDGGAPEGSKWEDNSSNNHTSPPQLYADDNVPSTVLMDDLAISCTASTYQMDEESSYSTSATSDETFGHLQSLWCSTSTTPSSPIASDHSGYLCMELEDVFDHHHHQLAFDDQLWQHEPMLPCDLYDRDVCNIHDWLDESCMYNYTQMG